MYNVTVSSVKVGLRLLVPLGRHLRHGMPLLARGDGVRAPMHALPQQVMVPAVVLLLQAPLELGVAVGALYAAVTATVAERKQSRRHSYS